MKKFYSQFKLLIYFLIFVFALKGIFLVKEVTLSIGEFDSRILFFLPIFKVVLWCYLIFILTGIYKIVITDNQLGVFSSKKIQHLKKISKALIFYVILTFVLDLIENWSDPALFIDQGDKDFPYTLGYVIGFTVGKTISSQMPMLLLALFFSMLAEVANNGYQFKKENDLTI